MGIQMWDIKYKYLNYYTIKNIIIYKSIGPAGIRTPISRFKVDSVNHYTTGPVYPMRDSNPQSQA